MRSLSIRRLLSTLAAAIVCVALCWHLRARAGDDQPKTVVVKSDDPTLLRAFNVLAALREQALSDGMQEAAGVGDLKKSVFYPELGGARNVRSFQVSASQPEPTPKVPEWWIDIASDDLRVTQITFSPPARPQALPHTPAHTRKWAITQSKKFCSVLRVGGATGIRVVDAQFVQYVNHRYDPNGYMNAYWRVTFQRFAAGQYPVVGDQVAIAIDERYGVRSYLDSCHTLVDEKTLQEPGVAQSAAAKTALDFARRLMAEGPAVKAYFGGHRLDPQPIRIDFVVARPNDLMTCRDFHHLKRDVTGRLVWAITFRLKDADGRMSPGTLEVYIDAHSGSFVGGVC